MGVNDQPSYSGLLLTHFEETRGSEISIDRLGRTGTEPKVMQFLIPRAKAAAGNFKPSKTFQGWSTISAQELRRVRRNRKLEISSSPVTEPEPNDNPYHGHITRPAELDSHLMALHLRYLFTTFGGMERVDTERGEIGAALFWREKLADLVAKSARWLISWLQPR
ncbi:MULTISPECIES: hypothetical protein [unclassified Bradyrhizobium]|uniref:hypothetical protein n=1 Tax=unclassified Bradyrhizobium TaxID=2631580 RepID=UPI002915DC37|nr:MULTISPECIES: hypothetical protein [unclassified Bradyrhizobium]